MTAPATSKWSQVKAWFRAHWEAVAAFTVALLGFIAGALAFGRRGRVTARAPTLPPDASETVDAIEHNEAVAVKELQAQRDERVNFAKQLAEDKLSRLRADPQAYAEYLTRISGRKP